MGVKRVKLVCQLENLKSCDTVLVTKRQVYGVDRYYPVNTMAKLATDLVGTKQVTDSMLRILESYGYTIRVASESEPFGEWADDYFQWCDSIRER